MFLRHLSSVYRSEVILSGAFDSEHTSYLSDKLQISIGGRLKIEQEHTTFPVSLMCSFLIHFPLDCSLELRIFNCIQCLLQQRNCMKFKIKHYVTILIQQTLYQLKNPS
jgi:hypothetical protein